MTHDSDSGPALLGVAASYDRCNRADSSMFNHSQIVEQELHPKRNEGTSSKQPDVTQTEKLRMLLHGL
ncbi:hypothetical protein CHLRE_31g758397v5 [Chlamydomonas reinhardtii]|uniref:Uncharacterized protein n=1 Tax=Chlamydomonas reinhardtii TaxID=3055 RepID=A0A2K3CMX5_CHLRE|nr:uncharacterized protein CHLRE_31g758397v5 [Chlamydomonas reinhardtii]PNW69636.1 hypothetical protein CHLRE_31g758397v5 [Chlamydomonas reinhardtii]